VCLYFKNSLLRLFSVGVVYHAVPEKTSTVLHTSAAQNPWMSVPEKEDRVMKKEYNRSIDVPEPIQASILHLSHESAHERSIAIVFLWN
jgi:DNA-directed RNA polymerase subunit E'/Rpb7